MHERSYMIVWEGQQGRFKCGWCVLYVRGWRYVWGNQEMGRRRFYENSYVMCLGFVGMHVGLMEQTRS